MMKELELRLRATIRQRGFSWTTEKAYAAWYRRFVRFHGLRHPSQMGTGEVEAFLSHLAINRGVSSSTQVQALSALLFLFKQ